MARPQKEINWDIVEKLIECGCFGTEIAAKFRIQSDTFYRRFKEEYGCAFQDYHARSHESGIADLRAMLHAKALNNRAPGNSNLLIFLARTKLGMKEPEMDQSVATNQEFIDQSHEIMRLQHKLAQMENNDDKPQTE